MFKEFTLNNLYPKILALPWHSLYKNNKKEKITDKTHENGYKNPYSKQH